MHGIKALTRASNRLGLLFLAWQHGGADPWQLWHLLDAQDRPLHALETGPKLPEFPERQRALILAWGAVAHEGLQPKKAG